VSRYRKQLVLRKKAVIFLLIAPLLFGSSIPFNSAHPTQTHTKNRAVAPLAIDSIAHLTTPSSVPAPKKKQALQNISINADTHKWVMFLAVATPLLHFLLSPNSTRDRKLPTTTSVQTHRETTRSLTPKGTTRSLTPKGTTRPLTPPLRSTSPGPLSSPHKPTTIWQAAPGLTWQWQLDTGAIDTSIEADVYNIDLFEVSAETVTLLHNQGRKVICYFSAGSWEEWRPDADRFPTSLLGKSNGWPGEKWLDIRQLSELRPLISARLDLCAEKGFDAVEPDNIDGYSNDTSFPLQPVHQLRFNRWLASAAHERGLAIALKNDAPQVTQLVDIFDFAIVEECYIYNECNVFRPFTAQGKAVFHAEYNAVPEDFCPITIPLEFSSIQKHPSLGAWRKRCAA